MVLTIQMKMVTMKIQKYSNVIQPEQRTVVL